MLVRYRLPVLGRLRIEFSFPIKTQIFSYDFEADELGVVKFINATAQVNDRSLWPKITRTPQPGIAADIQLTSPFFPILRKDLRAAEGVLALFGVDEIRTDEAEEFWEPESEAEKADLSLYSFKRNKEITHPSTWQRVPFDLVARSLIVAERAASFEIALNFFRKGSLDVQSEHYLDAVLDFLFMVETTYANGKFKTAQVEQEYLASDELIKLIEETTTHPELIHAVRHHNRIQQDFEAKYANKAASEIISYLINLRGELHHHSSRKRGTWHPTEHIRFGADAFFLQQLCMGIAIFNRKSHAI